MRGSGAEIFIFTATFRIKFDRIPNTEYVILYLAYIIREQL